MTHRASKAHVQTSLVPTVTRPRTYTVDQIHEGMRDLYPSTNSLARIKTSATFNNGRRYAVADGVLLQLSKTIRLRVLEMEVPARLTYD